MSMCAYINVSKSNYTGTNLCIYICMNICMCIYIYVFNRDYVCVYMDTNKKGSSRKSVHP